MSAVVDIVNITGISGSILSINKISTTLSNANRSPVATKIHYNGVDYAVFGNPSNKIVDFIYLTGSNDNIIVNKFTTELTTGQYAPPTTINYNGVDYAVFAGGYSSNTTINNV